MWLLDVFHIHRGNMVSNKFHHCEPVQAVTSTYYCRPTPLKGIGPRDWQTRREANHSDETCQGEDEQLSSRTLTGVLHI